MWKTQSVEFRLRSLRNTGEQERVLEFLVIRSLADKTGRPSVNPGQLPLGKAVKYGDFQLASRLGFPIKTLLQAVERLLKKEPTERGNRNRPEDLQDKARLNWNWLSPAQSEE